MNIRECKQCHKMVDFDEPWCDHETMEESAWLDIDRRTRAAAVELVVNDAVEQAAVDLAYEAAKDVTKMFKDTLDHDDN